MDTTTLAATVVIGTALVLAPIDPQPIRDLNAPLPEPEPEPECPYCGAPADASGCRIPQHDPRCPTRDPNF